MSHSSEIKVALMAHGMWKQRLRHAVEYGNSEHSVEKVKVDNQCDFGKWLYSLPEIERSSLNFKTVQDLHAKFHIEAANVLNHALVGNKLEAEKAMNTVFETSSQKLSEALKVWQETEDKK